MDKQIERRIVAKVRQSGKSYHNLIKSMRYVLYDEELK